MAGFYYWCAVIMLCNYFVILYVDFMFVAMEVSLISQHDPLALQLNSSTVYHQLQFESALAAEIDIDNFALTDLISIEELQQIQDICAETFGIASILTHVDGLPITRPSNFCRVCELVRTTEKGLHNCIQSARYIGSKAHDRMEPAFERCLSCGFIDASAPLIVAGKHIANWVFGQINHRDVDEAAIRRYALEIGLCPDELAAALTYTHDMPLPEFSNYIKVIWLLAQKLSTLAYSNLRLSKDNKNLVLAEKAIKQLNKDLENRIWEYEAANNELQETLATLQETQAQLLQQEKMASLGNLVAGIAHEINTPLGVGVTAASYLDQQTKALAALFQSQQMKKSDLEKYLTATMDATHIILLNLQRASELINSFKRVAIDRVSEERQIFNVKNYIGAILLSLRPNLKKANHHIVVHCDDFLELDSYPGAISQIITNLVMNSLIHAYPDGQQGTLGIEATLTATHFTLIYWDDGVGIAEQNLNRIFEPFFTTRRGKGGTGLGLNILYNLVTQNLSGTIDCHSQPGQGTRFIIKLPVQNGGTP